MAEKKKGFFIYADNWDFLLRYGSDTAIATVFKTVYNSAIYEMELNEEIFTTNDELIAYYSMASSVLANIKSQIRISEVKAENGKKGGLNRGKGQKSKEKEKDFSNGADKHPPSYDLEEFKKQALNDDLQYERKEK